MIGKTLDHYRVLQELGRGGMGEVYAAEDLSLDRKVALKFLPDAFVGDPERMARFEREAKLLASLNHSNIAAIYGLEQAEGKRFLVLELVEGETLAQRLNKGALPIDEALGVCRQIAEGLEAAHEKGVIHRDLKPANVMITEGDKVKILDFGLAKALSDETQSVDSSQSPTLTFTEGMTRPGVILGTAAYMSPEQAKGKAVDKRADIWAFGCILFECQTGKRAFQGETVTETLAAILKGEPDWQALPPTTPSNIRFVLSRCLQKEPTQRFHNAADLRLVMDEARGIGEETAPAKNPRFGWIIAAIFIVLSAILAPYAYMYFLEKTPATAHPIRFQIGLPEKVSLAWGGRFEISPDGRHLVFAGAGADGVMRLWVHSLDALEARFLPGTESDRFTTYFWSPDSRYIAFDAGGNKLKKADITGGPVLPICDVSQFAQGGSWNHEGAIIFEDGPVLKRVPAAGGIASVLLSKPNSVLRYPTFLPDGRHFLFWQYSTKPIGGGVYLGSSDSKPGEQLSKLLLPNVSAPVWAPSQDSGPGQILFLRDQTLMSQRFDDRRLELVGEPIQVAEQVGSFAMYGFFSASTNGVLVYRCGAAGAAYSQVMELDRQGKGQSSEGFLGGNPSGLAFSPDGARVAFNTSNDIWLRDFARDQNARFTFGQGYNVMPVWSPDGLNLIFASDRDGGIANLYQKAASGVKQETLLLKSENSKCPTSWSRDGRFLLYTERNLKTGTDLWVFSLGSDRKRIPLLITKDNESDGRISPDLRWVAYVSDESGRNEIYVRGFSQASGTLSETGGKWQISVGGGMGPRWRGDGKELYYRALDGKVMVVEIASGVTFQCGTPKTLIKAPPDLSVDYFGIPISVFDVNPDGNRFLLATPRMESSSTPFTVVLNWTALLKK
jgi:Tol biopolymer transport system component